MFVYLFFSQKHTVDIDDSDFCKGFTQLGALDDIKEDKMKSPEYHKDRSVINEISWISQGQKCDQ